LPRESGPLGAIVPAGGTLGYEASLVFLARTRETDGERRGRRGPGVSCALTTADTYGL